MRRPFTPADQTQSPTFVSPRVEPPELPRGGRRKLWDLPHKYHCPVIGTCLEVDELRRIAQRARLESDGPLSDYEVHLSFVGAADTKNPLSIATQKALERRYAASVARFAKARDSAGLLELWRDALKSGGVPGALWAVATHARTDAQVLSLVYADIHMLSHQIGAGQRVDLARLAQTQAELVDLRARHAAALRRHTRDLEVRDLELARLRTQAGQGEALEVQLALARQRIEELESGHALSRLNLALATLEPRLADLERERDLAVAQLRDGRERQGDLEAEIADLRSDLAQREEDRQALEALVLRDLAPDCDHCDRGDCRVCPDLGGRRVLCVGGRHALAGHYRALVARVNGRFERHDGGLEDSRARLEAMLAAADAVLCPADCVSHDAYYRVKRFCKRHAKPCVLINGSGISAFARALERVADEASAPPPPFVSG